MKRLMIIPVAITLVLLSGFSLNSGYEVGDEARDFELMNVDDKMVSMSSNPDNKGYIIIFTCNTCPWAKGYEQRIIDLHNKYSAKGYPVIAIQPNDETKSAGDSFEEMKKRASDKNYPFPYLLDESQEIALAYGATKTPDVFLVVKSDKKYILEYKGTIDDNPRDGSKANEKYVENAVDQLLAGEDISTKTTKGVGCGIKWSDASKEKRNNP